MYIRQWGEISRPHNLTGVWVCMYGGGGGDTINQIMNPGIRKWAWDPFSLLYTVGRPHNLWNSVSSSENWK